MVGSRLRVCKQSGYSGTACRTLLQNNLQLFPTLVNRQNTSLLILPHHIARPEGKRDVCAKPTENFFFLIFTICEMKIEAAQA